LILQSTFVDTFAGVKDVTTVPQNLPLAELGMDSMMAVEIKQTLEREFDVFLTAQDIRNLNFAKLTEMRDKDAEKMQSQDDEQQIEASGMQLIIRIMSDKDVTPEVCLKLKSKENPRKVEVFLVPGIEGCGQVFEPLASKIKPIAFALQHAVRHVGHNTSIQEIANSLLPVCIHTTSNDLYISPETERRLFVYTDTTFQLSVRFTKGGRAQEFCPDWIFVRLDDCHRIGETIGGSRLDRSASPDRRRPAAIESVIRPISAAFHGARTSKQYFAKYNGYSATGREWNGKFYPPLLRCAFLILFL